MIKKKKKERKKRIKALRVTFNILNYITMSHIYKRIKKVVIEQQNLD